MRNYIFIIFIVFFSCENYFLPKESAYLRLDYPKPEYELIDDKEFPFFFEANSRLSEISDIDINSESIDFIINYNQLNAQINFQYKNVNSKEKLNAYILDLKTAIETHSMIANSVKIKDYSLKESDLKDYDLEENNLVFYEEESKLEIKYNKFDSLIYIFKSFYNKVI